MGGPCYNRVAIIQGDTHHRDHKFISVQTQLQKCAIWIDKVRLSQVSVSHG